MKKKTKEESRIKFRYAELVAKKNREDDFKWTLRQVSKKTGIDIMTLLNISNNKTKGIYMITLQKLIDFFGCEVSDFFIDEGVK